MLYLSNQTAPQSEEMQNGLRAADGYLYLGMLDEALEELDRVPASEQSHASVLLARIRALLHKKDWVTAEKLSTRGAVLHPHEGEFTVQRAFALHQLEKSHEAVAALLAAPEWIRRTGILHYNLACYEARLGDLSAARQCIDTAIQMNAAIKKNASSDPDLEALYN